MKIKLLIATSDKVYAHFLSNVLSEKYSDSFEVSVSSSYERLKESDLLLKSDIVFLDYNFASLLNLKSVRLPLILNQDSDLNIESLEAYKKINKYQRISHIVRETLEFFAENSVEKNPNKRNRANVVAVWSPCGGVGKTTISLAYASKKSSEGKDSLYLNLENFSSVPTYFSEQGKSISSVFSKLDSNVSMLLKSIMLKDSSTGISYFSPPYNYDDINALTTEDIEIIINSCCEEIDELIIDLSSNCTENVQKVFDMSDYILLISDNSKVSKTKLNQFLNQHNIAEKIQEKSIIVSNKGGKMDKSNIKNIINIPFVQSTDPIITYKSVSSSLTEW